MTLVTPPDAEDGLITLAQAKAQCRTDHDDEDVLLAGYAASALSALDGPSGTGVAILTQQWRLSLDRWPLPAIIVPLGPVQSVDSITYVPFGTSSPVALDPSQYAFDLDAQPLRIRRAPFVVWPLTQPIPGAIKVTFTAGFGDTVSDMPPNPRADFTQAALLLISHWYEHRDAVVGVENRDSSTIMPLGVDAILDRYRVGRFA